MGIDGWLAGLCLGRAIRRRSSRCVRPHPLPNPGQRLGIAWLFDAAAFLWHRMWVSRGSHPEAECIIRLHAHAQIGYDDSIPDLLHRIKSVREPLQTLNRPVVIYSCQQPAVGGIARHSDVPVPVQKRIVALGIPLAVHRQHSPEERVERRRGGKKHAVADALALQGCTRDALDVNLGSDAPEKIKGADRKTDSISRAPALHPARHDGGGQHAGQQGQRVGRVDDEQRRPHHRRRRQGPEDLRAVNR